jgi:predicted neuraminidase
LPGSRHRLDLSQSVDGEHWALAQPQALVEGQSGQEFSYPALTWANDSLWVSYTDQRRQIAWQRFAAPALRP